MRKSIFALVLLASVPLLAQVILPHSEIGGSISVASMKRRLGFVYAPAQGTAPLAAGMVTPTQSGSLASFNGTYYAAIRHQGAAPGFNGAAVETRVAYQPILKHIAAINLSAASNAIAFVGLSEGTYGNPFTIPTSTPQALGSSRCATWVTKPAQGSTWWMMTSDGTNWSATDSGITYTADEVREFTVDMSVAGQVTFKTRAAGAITSPPAWGAESSFVKTTNIATAGSAVFGIYAYGQNNGAGTDTYYFISEFLEQNL